MSLPDDARELARSYDLVPYESLPISETHPANLAVQGILFGMAPADPERCRVLELGCAAGGNLIPMAYRLPGSEFLGIELSASQAAAGTALIDRLGLGNARIERADILDLGDLGRFDYVIAHGLYSWTPAAVREKLLALCGEVLSPHGIAYVSYNTLPGWRERAMLRDMLLYGVREAVGPEERLALACATLDRLDTALRDETDPAASRLSGEIARLRVKHPSYLYHEYLAEVNEPVLFSTFMSQAAAHGLQYLCEVELHTMFADSLGKAGAALIDRFDDLLEQEQYMDFLRRRTFCQTLLCRDERALARELDLERFRDCAFYARLLPREPVVHDGGQAHGTLDGGTCLVRHPLTRAALAVLAEGYPDAVDFGTLAREARHRAAGAPSAGETDHLLGELVGLYLRQFTGLRMAPERFARPRADRPRATALALAQADAGLGHLATVRHMPLGLDAFAVRLVTYLDGSRTRAELVDRMTGDIVEGRLSVGAPLPDEEALRRAVAENCGHLLAEFARHGVLADPR
ncbi:methyltransferase [Sulfurifustis variabilis]|uniref:Methyltransferase n=1 Tax=Sulfurifustis variabilis TaxID=1675686 RepID=A0A1B4V655_9GAMM|nr:class I SAM-dependent methyltransferase [Sulfurifustis variabilis]BAU49026.1 methyltransferase [Sulfurifustis variabilis]